MVTENSAQFKTSLSIKDLKIEPLNVQRFANSQYFYGDVKNWKQLRKSTLNGYSAQRALLEDNLSVEGWTKVADRGIEILKGAIGDVSDSRTIEISVSEELQKWRDEQLAAGRVLPAKRFGLTPVSKACRELLGIEGFPRALLTTDCVFGAAVMNMVIGAYDPKVLLSNYIVDCSFYYDHGYHKFFPEFEAIIEEAMTDVHARSTPAGAYRRDVARQNNRFIREKITLEYAYNANLGNRSVSKLTRDEAFFLNFCDCSMWAYCAEAIALGADLGGVVAHAIIGQLSHCVVDVGSDIQNSETLNSFLITADIHENGGEVNEDILRRIYDAYASLIARPCAEEYFEPEARACSFGISWHMQNDRHDWLRRAVLGYEKIREHKGGMREADLEEAFDKNFHTTGFSRPLKNPCNGEEMCDHVEAWLAKSHNDPLLKELWYYFAEAPLEYASKGVVDEGREEATIEGSRIALCRAVSYGLAHEITWVLGHAAFHAWQVNYLNEASMFGSFLDNGDLKGKVDWYQG